MNKKQTIALPYINNSDFTTSLQTYILNVLSNNITVESNTSTGIGLSLFLHYLSTKKAHVKIYYNLQCPINDLVDEYDVINGKIINCSIATTLHNLILYMVYNNSIYHINELEIYADDDKNKLYNITTCNNSGKTQINFSQLTKINI